MNIIIFFTYKSYKSKISLQISMHLFWFYDGQRGQVLTWFTDNWPGFTSQAYLVFSSSFLWCRPGFHL